MPETVIVTLRYEGREQDYSLPLQAPIAQWIPVLEKTLGAGENSVLCFEGKELDRSVSLASHHVWDGSVLVLTGR